MKNKIIAMLLLCNLAVAQDLILDNETIILDKTVTASIDKDSGNIILTSEGGVSSWRGPGPAPGIVTFSADPANIDSGEDSSITVTVTNVNRCDKSGDWSGTITNSQFVNNTYTEVISGISESSTFNIICYNSESVATELTSTNVTINGNAACDLSPPILGGREDRLIASASSGVLEYNGQYLDWLEKIGRIVQNSWPGQYASQVYYSISKDHYVSAEFTTDLTNAQAKLVVTPSGNRFQAGPPGSITTLSISECPGDFTTHLNQATCLAVGGGRPQIRWSQNPNADGTTHCKLDYNKKYYINVVHSNSVNNNFATSTCSSSRCSGFFSHTNEVQN